MDGSRQGGGGLRGWNVSLALQGSHPPERWRTAQSLLINHCQGCPGPGPDDHLGPAPVSFSRSPTRRLAIHANESVKYLDTG